jgi:hypothetical protein
MHYIRVKWIHAYPDEPIEIYSEFDEDRWETRKIEIFRDGTASYASSTEHSETSILAEVPISSLKEINSDPQFQAVEITQDEFQQLWVRVVQKGER